MLLSRVNFFGAKKEISIVENMNLQMYRRTAEALMCMILLPPVTSQKTNGTFVKAKNCKNGHNMINLEIYFDGEL